MNKQSTRNNFNYVLLDWDGCLANTLPVWLKAYKKTFALFDLFPSTEDIVTKAFGDFEGPQKLGAPNNKVFMEKLRYEADETLPYAELNPNVKEVVIQMKHMGKRLCIVTSSRRAIVEPAMKHNGVDKLVEFLLTSEDVRNIKPNPEIIRTSMRMFETDMHSQTLIVGDGDKDVNAGKNAKIATCLFYPKENESIYSRNYLESLYPDFFITDFKELLSIVS